MFHAKDDVIAQLETAKDTSTRNDSREMEVRFKAAEEAKNANEIKS